jgi:hypothetical protein
MITGRRSTDWLAAAPQAEDASGERREHDRRQSDRRAPRRRLDTLFAATLINQVTPSEDTLAACPYAKAKTPRAGMILNFEA